MLALINLFLAVLFTFLFFLYPAGDADLGWHDRYGEAFFQNHHLLTANIFSYTMPEFIWPNHSWGYDLILYQIFHQFSYLGLTISAAFIIALSFLIAIYGSHRRPGIFISTLIFAYFGQYLLNTGLRSQLVSLLFLVILWRLLQKPFKQLYFYLFPLIFIFWANLHGQFIIGLGLIFVYAISNFWQKPSNHAHFKLYLYLFLVSLTATLINPYGPRLILVAIEHLTAPTLQYIFEWMPWELNTQRMWALLAYSLLFWLIYYPHSKKQPQTVGYRASLGIINLLAIKARRMIPVFLLYSLPQFSALVFKLKLFSRLRPRFIMLAETFLLSCLIFYCVYKLLPPRKILSQSMASYCQITLCSPGLINFINHNQIQGRVFNAYSLGGFLIQFSPEVKPFIDGRMVAWHQGDWYPFQDYNTIVHNLPGAKTLFDQTNFDYVVTYNESEITPVIETVARWPVIYRDNLVTMFARPYLL